MARAASPSQQTWTIPGGALTLYIVGFIPAVWTFYLGVMDQLGADPMKVLERSLGLWSLRFLILTLAITPLRRFLGVSFLRYRRALGLLAFWYGLLHLSTYLVLDQGLDVAAIWKDIVKRPFITVGMASFLILLPLAVTSNSWSIKRLGALWQKLHRWVYVAALGAALHFIMLVKAWPPEPLIYAGLVIFLLALRLVPKSRPQRLAAPLKATLS